MFADFDEKIKMNIFLEKNLYYLAGYPAKSVIGTTLMDTPSLVPGTGLDMVL